MRATKLILTALFAIIAVTAGLVVAAVAALAGVALFVASRLLGRPKLQVGRPVGQNPPRSRTSTDAIEVTATEVPTDAPQRLRGTSTIDNPFTG